MVTTGSRMALVLGCALAMGLAMTPLASGSARASGTLETLAYEGFDYAGDVGGQTGGTGWSGAWSSDANTLQVNPTGLTYPGLTTVGGTSQWKSPGNPNSYNGRSFPRVDSGVVYLQFLSWFSGSNGGGTPNIRFSANGVQTGAVGNNDNRPNMALLDGATLNEVAVSNQPLAQLNLTILRIDYDANATQMWVNPDLATFDYANPPAASATANSYAPAIDQVFTITRNNGQFDEIKIMRFTPASPPPAPRPIPAMSPAAQEISAEVGVPIAPTSAFTLDNFTLVPRFIMYPQLPGGLTMDPATGVVSGTPTEPYASTRHWITATAGGNSESAYSTLQVSVAPGPEPTPSPSPTPAPTMTIVVTGQRSGDRLEVQGATTGIDAGTAVEVWVAKGASSATLGSARPLVDEAGGFVWGRSANPRSEFTVDFRVNETQSNIIRFAPSSR